MTFIYILIIILIILLSITLHEAMHAFTSHWLGDDLALHAGRLTLNPLAHIDPFLTILLPISLAFLGLPIVGGAKPVPFNPYRLRYGDWGQAIVGVAGPLTNLLLAVASGIWLRILPFQNHQLSLVIQEFSLINLGFFIFNMLPIPPLDGSRLLYAILPSSLKAGYKNIERNGMILILVIIVVFGRFLLPILSILITSAFRLITGIPVPTTQL